MIGGCDAADSASRYLDLREAGARYRSLQGLWRFGMETVHWGVVESNHLVDVVNQLDPRADVDLEAKLGQPLASYTRFLDRLGRVELMWMPYMRPRPLVGNESRQRLGPAAQVRPTHAARSSPGSHRAQDRVRRRQPLRPPAQ